MHRIHLAIAAVLLVALPVLAADLGRFNDWPDSPQGYFMTADERAGWSKLATEGEAQAFVDAFLARRAPDFAGEIATRAEMADRYLTLGRTPGSRSLRGKVVILFGPPTSVYITDRSKASTKRDNPLMAGVLSNVGFTMLTDGGAHGNADSASSSGTTLLTVKGVRTYALTFSGDAVKRIIDRKDASFVIDADGGTGRDEFASRSAGREAEALFELAARASIVRK